MTNERVDRRVMRTKALLHEALLDLIVMKGYEAVTVQDVIDRANIGRSTFYFHFEDKERLLESCIEELFDFLALAAESAATPDRDDDSAPFRFAFSLPMLQHVQSHRLLYRAIAGRRSGAVVLYRMTARLKALIRDEARMLRESGVLAALPEPIIVEHVSATFWTVLHHWMEQETPVSAAETDRTFHRLVLHGIAAAR